MRVSRTSTGPRTPTARSGRRTSRRTGLTCVRSWRSGARSRCAGWPTLPAEVYPATCRGLWAAWAHASTLRPGKNRRSLGLYALWVMFRRRRCAGSSTSGWGSASWCLAKPVRRRRPSRCCGRRGATRGVSGRSCRVGEWSLPERLPAGTRFAVLASGSGTNLQALLDAYPREIAVVAGDREEAFAFERARLAGVPAEFVDPEDFETRKEFDAELAERVAGYDVGLVVGAGYMRILTPVFLERFPAVINVHPSLLPEFKGLNAVRRALEAGDDRTGVTVHLMVEEVDAGPTISQETVPILPEDTEETLLERLHPVEHRLLVRAVADYFWGRI